MSLNLEFIIIFCFFATFDQRKKLIVQNLKQCNYYYRSIRVMYRVQIFKNFVHLLVLYVIIVCKKKIDMTNIIMTKEINFTEVILYIYLYYM